MAPATQVSSVGKTNIGHVVLNVTDLQVSARFYCDVLGMRKRRAGVFNGDTMVFLTFGEQDHDLALVESRKPLPRADGEAGALGHVAFRIGSRLEELRGFKTHLDRLGIVPEQIVEHLYARSIYFRDPDGIALEVYVDSGTPTPFVNEEMRIDNPPLKLD